MGTRVGTYVISGCVPSFYSLDFVSQVRGKSLKKKKIINKTLKIHDNYFKFKPRELQLKNQGFKNDRNILCMMLVQYTPIF